MVYKREKKGLERMKKKDQIHLGKKVILGAEQLGFVPSLEKLCCYSLHPFQEGCVVAEEIFPGLITIA